MKVTFGGRTNRALVVVDSLTSSVVLSVTRLAVEGVLGADAREKGNCLRVAPGADGVDVAVTSGCDSLNGDVGLGNGRRAANDVLGLGVVLVGRSISSSVVKPSLMSTSLMTRMSGTTAASTLTLRADGVNSLDEANGRELLRLMELLDSEENRELPRPPVRLALRLTGVMDEKRRDEAVGVKKPELTGVGLIPPLLNKEDPRGRNSWFFDDISMLVNDRGGRNRLKVERVALAD